MAVSTNFDSGRRLESPFKTRENDILAQIKWKRKAFHLEIKLLFNTIAEEQFPEQTCSKVMTGTYLPVHEVALLHIYLFIYLFIYLLTKALGSIYLPVKQ